MLVMMMLALAAPNPHALDAPRRAFSTCLRAFENKSIAAKMEPAAYSEAIKTTCAGEAAALILASRLRLSNCLMHAE